MIDRRGWAGELDSGAEILALSGIMNYIQADRKMHQWFRFQIAGGGPGVAPDVDDGAGGADVVDVIGVRLIVRVVNIRAHNDGIYDYRRSFDEVRRWFRPRGIQYFMVIVPD